MNSQKNSFVCKLALGALVLAAAASGPARADVVVGTGTPTNTTLGQTTAKWLTRTPTGTGHMLVMPYFSTQNGNVTIFSVSNSDLSNAKAVKMRLRAAANGDNILDFTLLLAPGDMWSGVLRKNSTGMTEIAFQDTSCTVPSLPPGGSVQMQTFRLNPRLTPEQKAVQVAEGYIEIVQAADIPDLAVYGDGRSNSALFLAVKRGECQSPAIPGALFTNHTSQPTAAAQGLAGPTGGLSGKWAILNASHGSSFSGSMQAIQAINDAGDNARGNFVLFPQFANSHPAPDGLTADPLLRTVSYGRKSGSGVTGDPTSSPVTAASMFDFPDMSTPYSVQGGTATTAVTPLQQASQLSASFMSRSVRNEYSADPSAGVSDWTVSMPMRRFSVAAAYGQFRRLYSLVSANGSQFFHDGNMIESPADPAESCLKVDPATYLDRNGNARTGRDAIAFCGMTSVLSFGSLPTSLLGAVVARSDAGSDSFERGWGQVGFTDFTTQIGVPVMAGGFSMSIVPSQTIPRPLASPSLTTEHSYTR